jgi:hypothetical protein
VLERSFGSSKGIRAERLDIGQSRRSPISRCAAVESAVASLTFAHPCRRMSPLSIGEWVFPTPKRTIEVRDNGRSRTRCTAHAAKFSRSARQQLRRRPPRGSRLVTAVTKLTEGLCSADRPRGHRSLSHADLIRSRT